MASTVPEPVDITVSEEPGEGDLPEGDLSEGDLPACEDDGVDDGTDEGDDADRDASAGGPVEEEEESEDTDGDVTVGVDPDRGAACRAAAGIERRGATAKEHDAGSTDGIEHAIERVFSNCLKNPDAPGLANALEHLAANAARKAAHDAAKAAGRHGHTGGHGSDATPGHSGEAPGHSGEHGNPHV